MRQLFRTDGTAVSAWSTSGAQHFGPPSGDDRETTDPATLTLLRHVTDRCAFWRTSGVAGDRGHTVITEHTVMRPAKALRIRQGVHGNAGAPDGLTGKAGIVVEDVYHPLTWSGAREVTIPYGDSLESDPLPEAVQVEAADRIHVVWEAVEGGRYPSGMHPWRTPTRADIPGPYVGTTGAMSVEMLSGSPVSISGLTTDEGMSIAWLGDSFSEAGFVKYGFDAVGGFAWSELSTWAEGVPRSRSAQRNRLGANGPVPWDLLIGGHHGNNSTVGYDEQMEVTLDYWRWMHATGAKVTAKTLHPYTSSTDSWTSIEGQTLQPHRLPDVRWARNAWLLDGAPMSAGWEPYETGTTNASALRAGDPGHLLAYPVFDEAGASEDPETRVWKVDGGSWTVDGVHLTQHGSDMIQPAFEAWLREHVI